MLTNEELRAKFYATRLKNLLAKAAANKLTPYDESELRKLRAKMAGNPPKSTFYRWKQGEGVVLSQDTLERLSYIFGIYAALQVLLPRPEAADAWIKKPNAAPLFGGGSALARMLSGQVADLYVVRQYLDAQRGGWA